MLQISFRTCMAFTITFQIFIEYFHEFNTLYVNCTCYYTLIIICADFALSDKELMKQFHELHKETCKISCETAEITR